MAALATLRELGFEDEVMSLKALRLCDGDVEQATELLFEWGQHAPPAQIASPLRPPWD